MNTLTVVKIGGHILDDAGKLPIFLNQFAAIPGPKILIHGGGKIATEIGQGLGIEPNYTDGRRITDAATLRLVTMVYAGLVNKELVATLQASGCNAIGLTGADGDLVRTMRRPVKEVDYGFVGDILPDGVRKQFLEELLLKGMTPVIAPITHDGAGTLLNTNADTIAQAIACSLSDRMSVQLIYCFEKAGVLADAGDEGAVLASINQEVYGILKERKVISGGMIPKLDNAFTALSGGVAQIIMGHAGDLPALISGQKGTCLKWT